MKQLRHHIGKLFSVLLLSMALALPVYAEEKLPFLMVAIADSEDEALYKQQSVLIYKFISYFTWPQTIYLENNVKSITICIFGKDKLGNTLEQLAANAVARDKLKIRIKRDAGVQDAGACSIAYIPDSQKPEYEQILAGLGKYPILTVSDIDGFAENGGIVEFTVKRGKLKFVINKSASSAQKLKVSADLLELAVKVIE